MCYVSNVKDNPSVYVYTQKSKHSLRDKIVKKIYVCVSFLLLVKYYKTMSCNFDNN